AAALRTARELNLAENEVRAGLLPQEKEQAIRDWQASGERVAMVGDGINDAPALAAADASVAMGEGADIALEASDCALLQSDLDRVPRLLTLCRKTLRTIRLNLFWAFAYNLIALPLASGVFERSLGWTLTPASAALAMSLSSVAVVASSLLLRRVRLG
ncbi:MAG: HAD-IC family P-type ATPase, partial [Planctomycetota bacterium]